MTINVVAAIINYNGKFLVTQRGYGDFKGYWEFPGGKIEPGETPENALKREIKEELNLEIEIEKWVCTTDYDYPNFHLTMHCYLCAMVSDHLELREHSSARGSPPILSMMWNGCPLIRKCWHYFAIAKYKIVYLIIMIKSRSLLLRRLSLIDFANAN